MDLLEDLKMSLLSFSFAMIYIIHEVSVLLKNDLNYILKIILSNAFLKKYNRLLFF